MRGTTILHGAPGYVDPRHSNLTVQPHYNVMNTLYQRSDAASMSACGTTATSERPTIDQLGYHMDPITARSATRRTAERRRRADRRGQLPRAPPRRRGAAGGTSTAVRGDHPHHFETMIMVGRSSTSSYRWSLAAYPAGHRGAILTLKAVDAGVTIQDFVPGLESRGERRMIVAAAYPSAPARLDQRGALNPWLGTSTGPRAQLAGVSRTAGGRSPAWRRSGSTRSGAPGFSEEERARVVRGRQECDLAVLTDYLHPGRRLRR